MCEVSERESLLENKISYKCFKKNHSYCHTAKTKCDAQWAGLVFLLPVSFRYLVGGADSIIDAANLRRPVPVHYKDTLNEPPASFVCGSLCSPAYVWLWLLYHSICVWISLLISLKYLTAFVASHLLVTSFEPGCDKSYR